MVLSMILYFLYASLLGNNLQENRDIKQNGDCPQVLRTYKCYVHLNGQHLEEDFQKGLSQKYK